MPSAGDNIVNSQLCKNLPICIIFGRPGSGKTTLAKAVIEHSEFVLSNESTEYTLQKQHHISKSEHTNFALKDSSKERTVRFLHLDLDCCIPKWMKENFSKGIYPTLEQRLQFASDGAEYVKNEIRDIFSSFRPNLALISFSFVNSDLRESFIESFQQEFSVPNENQNEKISSILHWILMDTSVKECNGRILKREGHFYENQNNEFIAKEIESEWIFAPVTFEHLRLDGQLPIQYNASVVFNHIQEIVARS